MASFVLSLQNLVAVQWNKIAVVMDIIVISLLKEKKFNFKNEVYNLNFVKVFCMIFLIN